MVSVVLPILQVVLTTANILIVGYTFVKFLGKPHDSLEQRVSVLESDMAETKRRLEKGDRRFDDLDEKYETFMTSMLAFLDFEIAYCINTHYEHTEDLVEARKALRKLHAKN